MRVLVVDDDPSGRYLLESIIRSGGHEVLSAVNGEDALAVARSTKPDIVITDILMPRMDGYQLCRAWKSDKDLCGVPLVFYTASYTDLADERFADGLGCDAFWRKPLDPTSMLERIEQIASRPEGSETAVRAPAMTDETEILQEYNERLVHKLEGKANDLENANVELRRAMEILAEEVSVKANLIAQLNSDVTERKRVEAELRKERDYTVLQAAALESAADAIAIIDDGGLITWANRAFGVLTGYAADEHVGMPVSNLMPDAGIAAEYRAALSSAQAGQTWQGETIGCRKDGSRYYEALTVALVLGREDADARYIMVKHDISESRQLEQLRSGFVANVSHELRTPLTSILGFADVLGHLKPEALPERAPAVVSKIRENAGRMKQLVEELLEVTTMQEEGIRILRRQVDIEQIVRTHAELVRRDPDHPLMIDVEGELPMIPCDADRLGRVVENLVGNAVKYSPQGGPITVKLSATDDEVLVAIRDEGIGIAAEDIPRLFDRFTQGDMSSTRSFGGVGIGLFVADQIVAAHGGRIGVDSAPGKGSTFTIHLPIDPLH